MKSYPFAIVFLLFSLLTACSSEPKEDNNSDMAIISIDNDRSEIYGDWLAKSWEISGSGEMMDEGVLMNLEFEMVALNLEKDKYTITFNKDNTVTSSSSKFRVKMTSKVGGMEFDHEMESESLLNKASWEQKGDIINIVIDDESGVVYPYKIKNLTKSELVLELGQLPESLLKEMGDGQKFKGEVKMVMIR